MAASTDGMCRRRVVQSCIAAVAMVACFLLLTTEWSAFLQPRPKGVEVAVGGHNAKVTTKQPAGGRGETNLLSPSSSSSSSSSSLSSSSHHQAPAPSAGPATAPAPVLPPAGSPAISPAHAACAQLRPLDYLWSAAHSFSAFGKPPVYLNPTVTRLCDTLFIVKSAGNQHSDADFQRQLQAAGMDAKELASRATKTAEEIAPTQRSLLATLEAKVAKDGFHNVTSDRIARIFKVSGMPLADDLESLPPLPPPPPANGRPAHPRPYVIAGEFNKMKWIPWARLFFERCAYIEDDHCMLITAAHESELRWADLTYGKDRIWQFHSDVEVEHGLRFWAKLAVSEMLLRFGIDVLFLDIDIAILRHPLDCRVQNVGPVPWSLGSIQPALVKAAAQSPPVLPHCIVADWILDAKPELGLAPPLYHYQVSANDIDFVAEIPRAMVATNGRIAHQQNIGVMWFQVDPLTVQLTIPLPRSPGMKDQMYMTKRTTALRHPCDQHGNPTGPLAPTISYDHVWWRGYSRRAPRDSNRTDVVASTYPEGATPETISEHLDVLRFRLLNSMYFDMVASSWNRMVPGLDFAHGSSIESANELDFASNGGPSPMVVPTTMHCTGVYAITKSVCMNHIAQLYNITGQERLPEAGASSLGFGFHLPDPTPSPFPKVLNPQSRT